MVFISSYSFFVVRKNELILVKYLIKTREFINCCID